MTESKEPKGSIDIGRFNQVEQFLKQEVPVRYKRAAGQIIFGDEKQGETTLFMGVFAEIYRAIRNPEKCDRGRGVYTYTTPDGREEEIKIVSLQRVEDFIQDWRMENLRIIMEHIGKRSAR